MRRIRLLSFPHRTMGTTTGSGHRPIALAISGRARSVTRSGQDFVA